MKAGIDRTRRHDRYADAAAREFLCQGFTQRQDECLARVVGSLIGPWHIATERCHIDDVPAPALAHVGNRVMHEPRHRRDIQRHQTIDRLDRLVGKRPAKPQPGVVDENVDVPSASSELLQQERICTLTRHVERDGDHLTIIAGNLPQALGHG